MILYRSQSQEAVPGAPFVYGEFYSKSPDIGDSHPLDYRLIDIAVYLRNYYGVPMSNFSTFRTKVHNASVGGASNSMHLRGNAIDLNWLVDEERVLTHLFYQIEHRTDVFAKLLALGGREFIMYGGQGYNFLHIGTEGPVEIWDKRSPSWKKRIPGKDPGIIDSVTGSVGDVIFNSTESIITAVGLSSDDDSAKAKSLFFNQFPIVELYLKVAMALLGFYLTLKRVRRWTS